jgi:hypothetical protein
MSDTQVPSKSVELLQDELWRVWATLKKLPVESPLSPNDLSDEGKTLFEAAIVGKRITEIEVGLDMWGVESTFQDHIKDWKQDKLYWACQIFLNPDGSFIPKTNAIEFRNLLKRYCDENSLTLNALESEYLKKVNSLPFFPVYDWLFGRELEFNTTKSRQEQEIKEQNQKPEEINATEEKQSFLSGMVSELSGFLKGVLLLIIIGISSMGAKYCSNQYSKDQRAKERSSLNSDRSTNQLIREELRQGARHQ